MSDGAPWPLIEVAVEPKTRADAERLVLTLRNLADEDPSFSFSIDAESGQVMLQGLSLDHLEQKACALVNERALSVNFGSPHVAYRETLGRRTEIDYTHKKQTGGTGQFARVKLVFEPGEPGTGFRFESAIVGGAVPKEYIAGVVKGLESAKENGLLAGFPVIDFKATLIDGASHDLDSSVLAFEIASRAAFRELREKAAPKLLEPIMKVEVVSPAEYLGSVIGDLNSRRGMVQSQDMRGDPTVVTAFVPLANMFLYEETLHGMCQGRAQFAMHYDHFAPVDLSGVPDPDDFPPAAAMRA